MRMCLIEVAVKLYGIFCANGKLNVLHFLTYQNDFR